MAKKRRRSNNEGTIYFHEKLKRWTAQVTLPNGKRKTLYGKTEKEVREKRDAILHEIRTGTYVEPSKVTLGEWLTRWLDDYKRPEVKLTTYENYKINVDSHIIPSLGNTQLMKLQANTLQAFYNDKLASGRIDGKGGLSTRVVRYLHTIIRQALEQATKEGLIPRNVADLTNPPKIERKPVQPLTEEQTTKFLAYATNDRLFPLYLLAATTGMRRGELCGLCWDSVDLESEPAKIIIQRQLLVRKGGLILEHGTKTKKGMRINTLTDDAKRELKAHKVRQAKEKLAMGEAYQDNNLVFCKEDGTFLDPREVTKRFQKLLLAAGLPKVRLHDLRHTHASLLLARGIHAKVVQERLGHSSITMTLDLYSHITPGLEEAAAASLNGLMSKEKSPQSAES